MNNYRNWTDDFNLENEDDQPWALKKSNSYICMKEGLEINRQESSGILMHNKDDPFEFRTNIPG